MVSSRGPLHAILRLVASCVFWGVSFPLMQMAADALARGAGWVERSVVQDLALRATYIGWRFTAAALFYALLTIPWQRGFRASEVRGGIVIGLFFAGGNVLQMAGLRYALPSVSAVLTSMVVVFTPFAQYFVLRRRVDAKIWQSVVVALVGILVLALPNPSAAAPLTLTSAAPIPWLGEGATLVASMLFTGQVLSVDHFGKAADPRRLTLVMFSTAAVVCLLVGMSFGAAPLYASTTIHAVTSDPRFVPVSATMVAFCSVAAFHLMNSAQPLVSPAVASVVYCLEPVFATAWSIVLGTESMTWLTLGGGGLVVLAMVRLARAQR
jgi:drug/metabolite transporter (DMT)-like permease